MNIKIKMLNVKDGDAIIIYLHDKDRKFVILIDGGHGKYAPDIITTLTPILKDAGKEAPDLFVCTHYDSDHIVGLIRVFKHFYEQGARNSKLWIHTPIAGLSKLLETAAQMKKLLRPDVANLKYEDQAFLNEHKELLARKDAYLVIESYSEMKEFVDYLKANKIPYEEPFQKKNPIKEWPEIDVVGPRIEYYNRLFVEADRFFPRMLNEELKSSEQRIAEGSDPNATKRLIDPCKYLDEHGGKSITATNRASVIMLITVGDKKFLFTGDAGPESFEEAKAEADFKNLHWLKVPHHGSCNNLSTRWIKTFSPKHAYVSGSRHSDPEVIECLRKHKVEVKSTKDSGTGILTGYVKEHAVGSVVAISW